MAAVPTYMHEIRSIQDAHPNLPAILRDVDLSRRIEANTPIDPAALAHAQVVAKIMRNFKEIGVEPLVTDAVVQSAELRARAMEAAHTTAEFAPINLVQALQGLAHGVNELRAMAHNNQNGLTELRNEVTQSRHESTQLRNEFTQLRNEVTQLRNEVTQSRHESTQLRAMVTQQVVPQIAATNQACLTIQAELALIPIRITNASSSVNAPLSYPPGHVAGGPLPGTKLEALQANGAQASAALQALGVQNIPAAAAERINVFHSYLGI